MPIRIIFLHLGVLISFMLSGQIYTSIDNYIGFVSDAPLEIIKAESENLQGALDLTKNTFAFKLFIKSFDGFNSPLQKEHFYENYLEADIFPNATFSGKVLEEIKDGQNQYRAKGILNIHGVENEVIIKVQIFRKEEKVEFRSDFQVKLDDYNIELPKIVYQKIAEIVDVHTEGTLLLRQ